MSLIRPFLGAGLLLSAVALPSIGPRPPWTLLARACSRSATRIFSDLLHHFNLNTASCGRLTPSLGVEGDAGPPQSDEFFPVRNVITPVKLTTDQRRTSIQRTRSASFHG